MNRGERIKARRIELGLSVDQVAAQLGKNRATIYRYESNDIEDLPTTVLGPLAKVLETTPSYLMGWEEFNDNKKAELRNIAIRFTNAARKENLSLSEIAKISGVPLNVVDGVAKGTLELPVENMEPLARAVNMPLFVLLGWETEEDYQYERDLEEAENAGYKLGNIYASLTDDGKQKLMEYANDLLKIYKK